MPNSAVWTAFLCGLGGLAMQLSISRLIFFYVANSEHTTALVIATHLSGFLLGALLKRYWLRSLSISAALYIIVILSLAVLWLAYIGAIQFVDPVSTIIILIALLLFIAIMFGFAVAGLVMENPSGTGATDIVISDALGSVIGAVLAGFIILPIYGIQASLVSGIVIVFCAILLRHPKMHLVAKVILPVVAMGLVAAVITAPQQNENFLRVSGMPIAFKNENMKILREAHTPFGELSVIATKTDLPDAYGQSLLIDNKALCAVSGQAETRKQSSEWLLGDLPAKTVLTKNSAPQFAVIGLGCGMTLGAVLDATPNSSTIDMIEINPEMPAMTKLFDRWNGDILSDPRVRLKIKDGFGFFMNQQDLITYDAVIMDLAWMQNHNSSHLFSREFYESVKKSLQPYGVVAVWTEERAPTTTVAVMYKTLATVFKHVVVNGDRGYFIIFASDDETALNTTGMQGSRGETGWVHIIAESAEINRLDNLVLNRTKFTLFSTRDPSEISGPSVYQRLKSQQNP